MADEYTPTTEQVRAFALGFGGMRSPEHWDNWLAAHDRETKAESLHDAAEEIDRLYFGPDQDRPFSTGAKHKWGAMQAAERVRARADRLKKGADRG